MYWWFAARAVAIVGGIALLPFLSHSLGLDDQSFWLAALYCTLIPSMASSTPTGILRAVDRFDLIAVQQATKPFLRAAGSVAAWYFDFGLRFCYCLVRVESGWRHHVLVVCRARITPQKYP